MDADTPAAPGGFTFADKRKINPDGGVRPPSGGGAPAGGTVPPPGGAVPPSTGSVSPSAGPTAEQAEVRNAVHDADSAALADLELDANAALAAERLLDLQRLQAEYANYRKRVDRDRNVARDSAITSVLESLLPVLDDISLARQHGDLGSGPFASIAEKLEATVGKYGVERYGEPGEPFDPAIHEALMHVEAELADGTEVTTVVGVLQPGYRLGERVIRPARVSVADPA